MAILFYKAIHVILLHHFILQRIFLPASNMSQPTQLTTKTLCHCFKNHEGRRSRFGIKIGDIDEYIERISEKDSQVSRT